MLVGGVVADRASRRAVMVAADVARLATQGTPAVAADQRASPRVWEARAAVGPHGHATGFFDPASTGLLPAVVARSGCSRPTRCGRPRRRRGDPGPSPPGVLVAAAGAGWALAVDAATFGVSAACSGDAAASAARRTRRSSVADLREGWGAFRRQVGVDHRRSLRDRERALGRVDALGPVVAERDLGGATAWSIVIAAVGVGALVGSRLATQARCRAAAGPRRPHRRVPRAAPRVPGGRPAGGVWPPARSCRARGMSSGYTVGSSTLQRHIPPELTLAREPYDGPVLLAFDPLGLAIWGPIAGGIGIGDALWIAFGLCVAAIIALLTVPHIVIRVLARRR